MIHKTIKLHSDFVSDKEYITIIFHNPFLFEIILIELLYHIQKITNNY